MQVFNSKLKIVLSVGILMCQPILYSQSAFPKKIKQSLKINKEKNNNTEQTKTPKAISVTKDNPYIVSCSENDTLFFDFDKIGFAGYEKEINSSLETFILINKSEFNIQGFSVDIVYKDLKERMLHKRNIELECDVPPNENRKFDIKSWDKQHTYYYYLGNKPKKTATPYKVEFIAVSFIIDTSPEI